MSVSSASFYSVISVPDLDESKAEEKSPRYMDSKLYSHSNDSVATSIFERDVERDSPFSLVNSTPTHYKSENFVAPALNASMEALNKKDYKSVEIVMPSTRVLDLLAASLGRSPRLYTRKMSVSRKPYMSVEDLVRRNLSVSFCSYLDYLEDERESENIVPHNIFGSMPRQGSVSKALQSSTTSLAAPSVIKKGKSLYTHTNTSNISVIEEMKFKSAMTRKMSILDDALDSKPQKDMTPAMPNTPTASPVNIEVYDHSAISSPADDIDDEVMEFEEEQMEFEKVLSGYTLNQKSALNVCSLDEVLKGY